MDESRLATVVKSDSEDAFSPVEEKSGTIDIVALPSALDQALAKVISPPSANDEKDATYYKKKARAHNTYRSYASAIYDFIRWSCHPNPFPTTAFLIEQYLVEMANTIQDNNNRHALKDGDNQSPSHKYAHTTLSHRLAALSWVHRMLDFDDPTQHTQIRTLLTGIKKDRIEAGWTEQQAPALSFDAIKKILPLMEDSLRDSRDKAFFLTSIMGALRQSEVVSLTVSQLTIEEKGMVITLGKTKTDQLLTRKKFTALPRVGGLFCPATALEAWLTKSEITEGPVFRGINRHGNFVMKKMKDKDGKVIDKVPTPLSHTSGNRIVKHWVNKAGVENADQYSGHSLRATFVTLARSLGIPDALIARQTHHRNLNTLNVYDRPEQILTDNPVLDVLKHFIQK